MENAYQILAGKAEAKRPVWRPWQEDNINMRLKETECLYIKLEEFKKTTLNAVITAVKKEHANCKVHIYIITRGKKKSYSHLR